MIPAERSPDVDWTFGVSKKESFEVVCALMADESHLSPHERACTRRFFWDVMVLIGDAQKKGRRPRKK